MLTAQDLARIDGEAEHEVDAAVAFAEAGAWEATQDLLRDVVYEPTPASFDAPAELSIKGQS